MKPWKTLKTEELIRNRWIGVRKDEVALSNGLVIDDFYVITIPDAAAVAALTPEGNLLLKREYRHACGEVLTELPAGMLEPEEKDSLAAAKRELLEETGYVSEKWTYLGATIESASKLSNRMHLYLALDCRKVSGQCLDEAEEVEIVEVPFEQAIDMVMKNEICCNSSAHGILKAARMVKRQEKDGKEETYGLQERI